MRNPDFENMKLCVWVKYDGEARRPIDPKRKVEYEGKFYSGAEIYRMFSKKELIRLCSQVPSKDNRFYVYDSKMLSIPSLDKLEKIVRVK